MALMQLAEANKRSKARPAPASAAKQPGASGWRVRSLRPVVVLATCRSVQLAGVRVKHTPCSLIPSIRLAGAVPLSCHGACDMCFRASSNKCCWEPMLLHRQKLYFVWFL